MLVSLGTSGITRDLLSAGGSYHSRAASTLALLPGASYTQLEMASIPSLRSRASPSAPLRARVGIDAGGTFTDFLLREADRLRVQRTMIRFLVLSILAGALALAAGCGGGGK